MAMRHKKVFGLMIVRGMAVRKMPTTMQEVTVRDGKGGKDRMTLFPEVIHTAMRDHLERVRMVHERDGADGDGCVSLPHALARTYPRWQRPITHRDVVVVSRSAAQATRDR